MRHLVLCCVLAGCSDGGGTPPPSVTMLVDQNEMGSLLSVWGSSPSDVWVVGGRPSLPAGPTVLHYDGMAWKRIDTGLTGFDLWWVFGFVGGDVLFGGSSGTILRYRDGMFEMMPTPAADGIVFGLWGPTADDVWAVGRAGTAGGAILWHYDGSMWSPVAPPNGFPPTAFGFKVNGQRTDDVWISCSAGVTLHWDGAFEMVPTGDPASLFSIVTTATDVVTAGGVTQDGAGALYENTGSGWQPADLSIPYQWRGLAASTDQVFVVGDQGLIGKRDKTGAWSLVKQSLIQLSFHAAWIDPDGALWGVGGNFDITPLTKDGFLLYSGSQNVPLITQ